MIPESRIEDVKKALQTTFEVPDYDDIKELTTGLSNASVLQIIVKGRPYVLKIARTDFLSDPTMYYFSCMKSAAEAGIAPKVWYTGIEDGISIVDFVELRPFPLLEARTKLADILRKLHSLPLFSKTIHSFDTVKRFGKRFRDANIIPGIMTEELFIALERITKVYPLNSNDLVPSHNDLKPENILYDGNKAWLSDWEAAFNNDRYSDISIVANFVVSNEDEEADFLNRYFGRKATEYELARFFLMCQVMHLSYLVVFMNVVASKGKKIEINAISKYDFRDFHDRIWKGEIDLAFDEPRLEYAVVHMEQMKKTFILNDLRKL